MADEALSPLFVGSGRAVVAAILAAGALALTRQAFPNRRQWARLAIVACGVVLGFPLLTSFALTSAPASHGAVVLASPLMIALTLIAGVQAPPTAGLAEWAAFAYLGVVSMFLGFFAWYHGLALGPMAQVSQIQLVQPVLSIAWAALILGENITWITVVGGVAVIACALLAVRTRFRRNPR